MIFRLSLLLLAWVLVGCTESPPSKPNIVFILADDLGWSDLPIYGNKFNEAPHIDRLAARGMRFTNAYAAGPVCSPTRLSILSGQYPIRMGMVDFIPGHWRPYEKLVVPINRYQYYPLENVSFAEQLKALGYKTGYFGKWHLGAKQYHPNNQGFDEAIVSASWGFFSDSFVLSPKRPVNTDDYLTDVITDLSLDFISRNKDVPFMAFISHFAVHLPLEAREEKIEKYKNKAPDENYPSNPVYAAMIEHLDDNVGRVVAKLKQLGIYDETIIIFYSDNGGLYQIFDQRNNTIITDNSPLRGEKGMIYEGGIRVPLVVSWPDQIPKGSLSHELVDSSDFYPTFIELAGGQQPLVQVNDGISLVDYFLKRAPSKDRDLFWHYPVYHHGTPASAIRRGPYKLIRDYQTEGYELYNLEDDISESNNLALALPELTSSMAKALDQWLLNMNAAMPTPNPRFDPANSREWGIHPSRPQAKLSLLEGDKVIGTCY